MHVWSGEFLDLVTLGLFGSISRTRRPRQQSHKCEDRGRT